MDTRITTISGKGIVVSGDNIDTDRIIPARFLKEITFSNLGKYPFFDERFNSDLSEREHPFNDAARQDANILFVNKNFGCGSSREHAPQALKRWGIAAVVGESFAEIFASNCMTLGVPTVCVSESEAIQIQSDSAENSNLVWTVDLENLSLYRDDFRTDIQIREHHREILVSGLWDSTNLLLENMQAVAELHAALPYIDNYQTKSMT